MVAQAHEDGSLYPSHAPAPPRWPPTITSCSSSAGSSSRAGSGSTSASFSRTSTSASFSTQSFRRPPGAPEQAHGGGGRREAHVGVGRVRMGPHRRVVRVRVHGYALCRPLRPEKRQVDQGGYHRFPPSQRRLHSAVHKRRDVRHRQRGLPQQGVPRRRSRARPSHPALEPAPCGWRRGQRAHSSRRRRYQIKNPAGERSRRCGEAPRFPPSPASCSPRTTKPSPRPGRSSPSQGLGGKDREGCRIEGCRIKVGEEAGGGVQNRGRGARRRPSSSSSSSTRRLRSASRAWTTAPSPRAGCPAGTSRRIPTPLERRPRLSESRCSPSRPPSPSSTSRRAQARARPRARQVSPREGRVRREGGEGGEG